MGLAKGKNFSVIKIPEDYELEIGSASSEINFEGDTIDERHAILRFDQDIGELIINDFRSKYGTHLLIQRPLKLFPNQPILIQSGPSTIRLELQPTSFSICSLFSCLLGKSSRQSSQGPGQGDGNDRLLYDQVRPYLPPDLAKHESERENIPEEITKKQTTLFNLSTVQLMPFGRSCCFRLKMKEIEDEYEDDDGVTANGEGAEIGHTEEAEITV